MTDKIDSSHAAVAAPSFTFEAPYDACVRTGLWGPYIALHRAGELIATFSFTEWGGEQGAVQAAWRFAYHVETCTECEALAAERDRLAAQLDKAKADCAMFADANARQAMCISFTAANLGPEYCATIEGLPKAARHVSAERDRLAAQLAEARAEGWRKGIEAAADVCTAVIRDYRIMKKDGVTYETARVQPVAHGLVSVAREEIRSLPTPADLGAPA